MTVAMLMRMNREAMPRTRHPQAGASNPNLLPYAIELKRAEGLGLVVYILVSEFISPKKCTVSVGNIIPQSVKCIHSATKICYIARKGDESCILNGLNLQHQTLHLKR